MINFLLFTLPALGPSMLIVPGFVLILMGIALIVRDDKFGSWTMGLCITLLMVWGLWIGCYHVFPVVPAYNNMCPADQQTAGYCDTGTK